MPAMNGRDELKRITESENSKISYIPLIAMSANTNPIYCADVSYLLSKLFSFDNFIPTTFSVLKRYNDA